MTKKLAEDFDIISAPPDQLGYFFETVNSTQYTVPIDESFMEASYYRGIVNMLAQANEQDIVIFRINSPGGQFSGLLSLLDAIETTQAMTIADITGQAASAASILALNCDQCVVGKYAEMLAHEVSYGVGGKGSDNLSHVQHIKKISDKLIWDTYEGFLEDHEIESVLNGKELFLDSDEIIERLNKREEYRKELATLSDEDNPGLTD
jgi:ATP-dependent protease ClpP protease subunit